MKCRILYYILLVIAVLGCKEMPKEKQSESEHPVIKAEEATLVASYTDLEGNPIEIDDYKGKRVLLNYWATWCGPCIQEMPALLKLQTVLTKENYVFLFASDESVQKIKKFKSTKGFDFKFIKYNGTYAEQQIHALPVTFIYNELGAQVLRVDGAMVWDSPETIEKLKKLE